MHQVLQRGRIHKTPTRTLQRNWKNYVGCKNTNSDIHHGFPEEYEENSKSWLVLM